MESAEQMLAACAGTSDLAAVIIGTLVQVLKNWREKRCGVSIVGLKLSLLVLSLRVPYLMIRGEWIIMIPGAIAIGGIAIQVTQFWLYRKKTPVTVVHGSSPEAKPKCLACTTRKKRRKFKRKLSA